MNIASSISISSNAPRWRAARKCGSRGIESRVDERGDELADPARGGQQTDVGTAVRDHGQIGDIGAEQRPHQRHRLAARAPAADADGHAAAQPGDDLLGRHGLVGHGVGPFRRLPPGVAEGVADAVGDPAEVRLEGEALLEAVAAPYVDGVDAVEGGLGQTDETAVLLRDLPRQLQCRLVQCGARDDLPDRAVARGVRRRWRCGRCSRARASGAAGPAGPDGWPRRARRGPAPAARRWRRRWPRWHPRSRRGRCRRPGRSRAPPRRPAPRTRRRPQTPRRSRGWRRSAPSWPRVALHLLDVDARVEAAALGGQHDAADPGVAAGRAHGVGQVVPALYGKGVDRREVDGDDGDALVRGSEVETPMSGSATFPPSVC